MARDPHRFINDLDETAIGRLIERLEKRAKDDVFMRLFDRYAGCLKLPEAASVLEIGCGTGAMARALLRRDDFTGRVLGVDQSALFIHAAQRFAQQEGVMARVEFRVADAHHLELPPASFDAVIAHTLISHVRDPLAVLQEMVRMVKPGGRVVLFDGDYASLTYAYDDHAFGRLMDEALASASFNNPLIMRDLPRLMPEYGLELTSAWGEAVVEIGGGSYFKSFAETYAPYVTSSGLVAEEAVEAWLDAQRRFMDEGTFFASCNYYTYIARPAESAS
jgi:SAM-dependent methyltransferase